MQGEFFYPRFEQKEKAERKKPFDLRGK